MEIKKSQISDEEICNIMSQMGSSKSKVLPCEENRLMKIYNIMFIYGLLNQYGIKLEDKILDLMNENLKQIFPYAIFPDEALYWKDVLVGYKMPFVKGISYADEMKNRKILGITPNLEEAAILYKKFEDILKKASENDIVITDFANPRNIILQDDSSIKIIDSDDFQMKNHPSVVISSNIESELVYESPKYKKRTGFTTELNSLSLLYLYFRDIFNIPLKDYLSLNENSYCNLTWMLSQIGLDDKEIIDIIATVYSGEKNPDFSEAFFKIAEIYTIDESQICTSKTIPTLVRK